MSTILCGEIFNKTKIGIQGMKRGMKVMRKGIHVMRRAINMMMRGRKWHKDGEKVQGKEAGGEGK